MKSGKAFICAIILYALMFGLFIWAAFVGGNAFIRVSSVLSGAALYFFSRGFYRWLLKDWKGQK